MSWLEGRSGAAAGVALLVLLAGRGAAPAEPGRVRAYQKISDTEGGFAGVLDDIDVFGAWAAALGDLDCDGIGDIAVGAPNDDDGGQARGAVWILFLRRDGTVKAHQKISQTEGGFTGALGDVDLFGYSVASPGDLDGDGVQDLAVGAPGDDDGGEDRGAVWLLLLGRDGKARASWKVSAAAGGLAEALADADGLGSSVAPLGDLDGDGALDLAAGAIGDDGAGTDRGAAWVLFLGSGGTLERYRKLGDGEGGFDGALDDGDAFGASLWPLGDLDSDGVPELAAGASGDDDGGRDRGTVWILFLERSGTVKRHRKVSALEGGFTGALDDADAFGIRAVSVGDLDSDGVADLAVGATGDDDGGRDRGAVWLLFLRGDGTVKGHQKISDVEGGFTGAIDDGDGFGSALACPGDLDIDGVEDLAVGACADGDGGPARGAMWMLFLEGAGPPEAPFVRGDLSGDGRIDVSDAVRLLLHLFRGAAVPCLRSANADGSAAGSGEEAPEEIGITDAIWILQYLFLRGPPPPPPFPRCGPAPGPSRIGCDVPPRCGA
ncbi:MAG: FG-GAP repeat protein [Planctomycetes bacterium]|nr:FG-GAP repeat protein [Planctomycetota bacterium]